MAKVVPTQVRYIDPATQQVLQFDNVSTDYFLSRVNNLTLNSIGHDLVLAGFNLINLSWTASSVTATLSNGYVLIDHTVVHVNDSDIEITLPYVYPMYADTGKFIIHCNFQFLQIPSPDLTRFEIRFSWIDKWTSGGSETQVLPHGWGKNSDRIILHAFDFTESAGNITNVEWNDPEVSPTDWPLYIRTATPEDLGPFWWKGQYYDTDDQNLTHIHFWELIEHVHRKLSAEEAVIPHSHYLDDLLDTEIESPAPSDGDLLEYNGSSQMWQNIDQNTGFNKDFGIISGTVAEGDKLVWIPIGEEIKTSNAFEFNVTVPTDTYKEFKIYYNIYAASQIESVRFTTDYREFMWTYYDLGSGLTPNFDLHTSDKLEDGYIPLTSIDANKEFHAGGSLTGEIIVSVSRQSDKTYVRNTGTYLQHDGSGGSPTLLNLHMFSSSGYSESTFVGCCVQFVIESFSNNVNDPGSATPISAMQGRMAVMGLRTSF